VGSTQHFLLTRLNSRLGWIQDYQGLDPEWLESRFALFERFCIPAVAAQAVQFEWLVFLDHETPTSFRDRLEPFIRSRLLTPIFVEGPLTDRLAVAEVRARVSPDAEVVITTRLDSDDGVRSDYLSRVQSKALAVGEGFLNFPVGVQWRAGRCYACVEASNPFISRVERRRPDSGWAPDTVFCDVDHDNLIRVFPVRQVLSPPAWLQVVHGKNVEREKRGIRWPLRRPPSAIVAAATDEFVLDPLPMRIKDVAITSRESATGIFAQRWVIEERARTMLRSWRSAIRQT
jgi:hypothetical protein